MVDRYSLANANTGQDDPRRMNRPGIAGGHFNRTMSVVEVVIVSIECPSI